MLLNIAPLLVIVVCGLAAPDPTPAPAPGLVNELLERQLGASLPLLGGTVGPGSICGNVGPISGCVGPDGVSGTLPGIGGTVGPGGVSGAIPGLSGAVPIGAGGSPATAQGSTSTGVVVGNGEATATLPIGTLSPTASGRVTASLTTIVVATTDSTGGVSSFTTTSTRSSVVQATQNAAVAEKEALGRAVAVIAIGGLLARLL